MTGIYFALLVLAATVLILGWTTFMFWRIAKAERKGRLSWKVDYYALREDYLAVTASHDAETGDDDGR